MIYIVTRWESTQMEPELEWQLWRQILGSFAEGYPNMQVFAVPRFPSMDGRERLKQFDTMDEAIAALPEIPRAFLEPTGYRSLHELPQGDLAIILGNTENDNMGHAQVNETYAIKTPNGTAKGHLYGTNAASIALAIRYGQ